MPSERSVDWTDSISRSPSARRRTTRRWASPKRRSPFLRSCSGSG